MNFEKKLSLKQNALWNAAGCFFYLGCQWLITVLVVVLSDSFLDSGYLAFAMATGNIFASVGLYKVRTYQVADIADSTTQEEYVGFRILTITVSAAVTTIYIFISATSIKSLLVSMAYLLFKADESFNDVNFGFAQKRFRMDFIGQSQFLRGFITVGLFTATMFFSHNTELSVLFMALGGISVTCLFDMRYAKNFGFTKPALNTNLVKKMLRDLTLPMLANLLATSIVSVSRQLYGCIGGEEALGIYASIATPAVLIQAGISYIYSPLLGKIAGTYLNHGNKEFINYLSKIYFLMILIIIVFSFVLYIPGTSLLLAMYGAKIEPYVKSFIFVLMATGGVALLYFINDVLIIMRSRLSQILLNSLAFFGCISSISTTVALFGMNGLNISIGISTTVSSFIGYVLAIYLSANQKL